MAITISTPTLYTLTGNKNEIIVTTETNGVTAHFLHLKIDVFQSDGVPTIDSLTDKLPVINGKATFEIQEFLRQKQTENFTELIVNSQEHDLIVSYTLSAFETYDYSNTEQNTIIDPTLYYAIQGKIESDYELRLETLASTFYTDWLQANKFLTNKPRTLNQLTNERLKLYYLALATESVDLVCDIVFIDASTSSITIETISMTENKIYELLVGFTELKLAAQETTSKISSYKIYLQATSWTSEVFEITIERDYYPNQHQFIFKNSFGVYDTILLRGIEENNKSYENVFGSINDQQLAVSKIATNIFSTASGILQYSIKSWIWEFSNSLDAYSIVSDIIYSIIIKNESDVSIVDNSFLYGHIIKYEQIKAVKQIVEYVPKIVIDISITDYTTQTTGITLNFTGSVKGKYDDGSEFDFGSGTQNIRTYTASGNYRLIIYGDLANITKINAENSRINNITNLSACGVLIDTDFSENIFDEFDFDNCIINGRFNINRNSTLREFKNLNENTIFTGIDIHGKHAFGAYECNLTGELNFNNALFNNASIAIQSNINLQSIKGFNPSSIFIRYFAASDCSSLSEIDFNNAKLEVSYFWIFNTGLTSLLNIGENSTVEQLLAQNIAAQVIDISNIVNISVSADFYNSKNLENVIFASSGIYNEISLRSCNLTNIFDFNNAIFTGRLILSSNLNLNNITNINPLTNLSGTRSGGNGGNIAALFVTNCDIQGELQMNGITVNDTLYVYNNPSMTGFSNFINNTIEANLSGNAFFKSSVDMEIQRLVTQGNLNGGVDLSGGTNAAPSSSGESNIDILRSRGWTVIVTGGY